MKTILRFFISIWRFFFPAKQTIVPPTISERIDNAKEDADDAVKRIYSHRYGHPKHNNRSNKKNKRGKSSRLLRVQYTPEGKPIYHDQGTRK